MVAFYAKWDKPAQVVTMLVLFALFPPALAVAFIMTGPLGFWLTLAAISVVTAVCWLLHPTGYQITRKSIYVRYPLGRKKYALNKLTEAQLLDIKQVGPMLPVFSSIGLFGYFGLCYFSKLGWVRLYATDTSKLVYLRFGNSSIIITPAQYKEFWRAASSLPEIRSSVVTTRTEQYEPDEIMSGALA